MKKTKLSSFSLALALATPVFGADDNAMTLVYPAPAAEIELDNSTPAKRTTPPTNRRNYEELKQVNEIAPIPPCENPALRDALERDPARWLREILPDVFFADFTDSQLEFIRMIWQAIRDGSWKNAECYRGFGKTSILSGLLLDAICQGIVRHALYVTAEGGASAAQAANWFFSALYDDYEAEGEDARLFTRLYPEILYPLQRREGKAQRPLTCDGVPLRIEMKSDRIVFPNVPGSRSAGSLLRFTSISSGGIRGANHTIPGVGSFRVRCVMLDDVQNDATAKSVVERTVRASR